MTHLDDTNINPRDSNVVDTLRAFSFSEATAKDVLDTVSVEDKAKKDLGYTDFPADETVKVAKTLAMYRKGLEVFSTYLKNTLKTNPAEIALGKEIMLKYKKNVCNNLYTLVFDIKTHSGEKFEAMKHGRQYLEKTNEILAKIDEFIAENITNGDATPTLITK